jgi:hypothetical protein
MIEKCTNTMKLKKFVVSINGKEVGRSNGLFRGQNYWINVLQYQEGDRSLEVGFQVSVV